MKLVVAVSPACGGNGDTNDCLSLHQHRRISVSAEGGVRYRGIDCGGMACCARRVADSEVLLLFVEGYRSQSCAAPQITTSYRKGCGHRAHP